MLRLRHGPEPIRVTRVFSVAIEIHQRRFVAFHERIDRPLSLAHRLIKIADPKLLRKPGKVMLIGVDSFLAAILLASQMDFTLIPNNYDGSISVDVSFRAGTKLAVMDEAGSHSAGGREL